MAAAPTHKFQAPKGTRDFFPEDMAIRRHVEGIWRSVSIDHGFDEIEGPTFEHLELYTVKSGDGIVSELFSFRRAGGETDYALRPEFTPTLARMAAARGAALARPTKWFCIPNHYRAERPQRGRLREFIQWNVDVLGDETAAADADVIAVGAGVLDRMGLTPAITQIRISHRGAVSNILRHLGVAADRLQAVFELLDRRDKMDAASFDERAATIGLDGDTVARLNDVTRRAFALGEEQDILDAIPGMPPEAVGDLEAVRDAVRAAGVADWCRYDLGIVRGLAYYTGTVFEVHETTGKERAIAGGGRYDQLVELFGGPPTPAVGIAMGDVVIRLVLDDHGLLQPAEHYLPRPDAFVVAAAESADACMRPLVADLRRAGLHARHSTKSTRNIGKLLKDAARARARHAVILDDDLAAGRVKVKDLDAGTQADVALDDLVATLKA